MGKRTQVTRKSNKHVASSLTTAGGTPSFRPMTRPNSPRPVLAAIPLTAAAVATLAGCSSSKLARETDAELRRSMLNALQREIADAERSEEPRRLGRPAPDTAKLEIRPEHLELIEEKFSTDADAARLRESTGAGENLAAALAGSNLMGQPTETATDSLDRAVQTAVANNLSAEFARYTPAINQATIVEAEAAFDWLFFGSAAWQDSSIPQASQGFGGSSGVIRNNSEGFTGGLGISRNLTTGGSLSLQHTLGNENIESSFFGGSPTPNPAYSANFEVELNQPLLRGFGDTVSLANIRLARNAERSSVADLRSELIGTITETERAYWTLVQAYRELIIYTGLLERGEQVRDDIIARRVQDARQAQVADAVARPPGDVRRPGHVPGGGGGVLTPARRCAPRPPEPAACERHPQTIGQRPRAARGIRNTSRAFGHPTRRGNHRVASRRDHHGGRRAARARSGAALHR